MVEQEIFSKIVKALQLSYSPKMKLKFFSRINWIAKTCKFARLGSYSFGIVGSLYQKVILFCAKLHLYPLLALVLYVGNVKHIARQGK